MSVPAKFENGVFKPLADVPLDEGTIVEVILPPPHKLSAARPSIKDHPFFGIWKDRADISDGVEYVDSLRENPRP